MGINVSTMMDNLDIDTRYPPGTKFITHDDNTYILLGYSSDSDNLICIKNNHYIDNNNEQFMILHEHIKKILYIPKIINHNKRFYE